MKSELGPSSDVQAASSINNGRSQLALITAPSESESSVGGGSHSENEELGAQPREAYDGYQWPLSQPPTRTSESSVDYSLDAPLPAMQAEAKRRLQLKEASQRSRKRQKNEVEMHSQTIAVLRQELQAITAKLEAPVSPSTREARAQAKERYDLQQRVSFLKAKLGEHQRWMLDLRNLMASAPLLDFAQQDEFNVGCVAKQDANGSIHRHCVAPQEIERLDAWRKGTGGSRRFSVVAVERRVNEFVQSSRENARKLLREFESAQCPFQLQFRSRGWHSAASAERNLITFRTERVLPQASAKDVAFELWRSVQREDIMRTFVPIVQDSMAVYDSDNSSLSRRLVQLSATGQPRFLVTAESIIAEPDPVHGWQISLESCHDSGLNLFAADCDTDFVAIPGSPPVAHDQDPDDGVARANVMNIRDVVAAATCQQEGTSVRLKVVGSARHNGKLNGDAHIDLVQYLVSMMPVYEDVHLMARNSTATLGASKAPAPASAPASTKAIVKPITAVTAMHAAMASAADPA